MPTETYHRCELHDADTESILDGEISEELIAASREAEGSSNGIVSASRDSNGVWRYVQPGSESRFGDVRSVWVNDLGEEA